MIPILNDKLSRVSFLCVLLFVFAFSNTQAQKKSSLSQAQKTNWIRVEGGEFLMGCSATDKECYPDEQPPHKVKINTFLISPYEVTVKEYRAFCHATKRAFPQPVGWAFEDNCPMTFISWQDAMEYAKWAGCRLLTEAEWEYAARGGNKSKGYTYSGSENPDEVGWSYENAQGKIHPVGQKKPNELGIYDMSGNAWEWCSDNYAIFYYKDSPSNNPKGPIKGIGKCNRGGCFTFDYRLMRTSHRRGSGKDTVGSATGFRLAKDISNTK